MNIPEECPKDGGFRLSGNEYVSRYGRVKKAYLKTLKVYGLAGMDDSKLRMLFGDINEGNIESVTYQLADEIRSDSMKRCIEVLMKESGTEPGKTGDGVEDDYTKHLPRSFDDELIGMGLDKEEIVEINSRASNIYNRFLRDCGMEEGKYMGEGIVKTDPHDS